MSENTFSLLEAIALRRTGDSVYEVDTHPHFWTIVSPFGGWSAAVALRAVLTECQHPLVPISMSIHFAGRIDAGTVQVVPTRVRENKRTAFWRCELRQGGRCTLSAQIALAQHRPTRRVIETVRPDAPDPTSLSTTEVPGIPWTTTYDSRFVTAPPGSDSGSLNSVFWVRLRHEEAVTFESLVSLCDACFPRLFFRTSEVFNAASLSMNIQFHVDHEQLAQMGHGFLLVEAFGNKAERGFFDQNLRVWTADGELIATSEQLFYYALDASS
ncbi:MAG: thioesterase family protein [Pseudomonadota bacterium]